MTYKGFLVFALGCLLTVGPAPADRVQVGVGGDQLVSGSRLDETMSVPRDLLVSGAQIVHRGQVADDLLAAGFAIDLEGATGGDITAAGARVRLDGQAGGDVTLSGMIATLDDDAVVNGNARIFAGTATHRGTVRGALLVAAGEVRLEGVVTGDLRVAAGAISFGPDARVDGRIVLALPDEVTVPPHVAPAGRVSYEYFDAGEWRDYDELAWQGMPEAPSTAAVVGGFLLGLAFLLATGAAFLALMPRGVANMRRLALARPGVSILVGGVGFSTLVGLVPVSAMTLVGLPFLPFAILMLLVGWLLGYLLGAYVVAMGIARALGLGDEPSIPARLGVLAAAITVAGLLNYIPLLGWILNVTLVFLGLGAMTVGLLRWMMPAVDPDETDPMMGTQ